MASFLQIIDLGLRALLFTKFEDILNLDDINRGVVFYPKDIAFRKMSEKKGESITEFVNVWRTSTALDWERQRTPVARRGMSLSYTDVNKTSSIVAKAVPVKLEYSVNFWTKDREVLNEITEKYLFWLQDDPNLDLNYTVGENEYPVELDLHFGVLTDESNVEQMYEKGTHFCMGVPINIDGWIFTSSEIGTILKIKLCLRDKNDLTDDEIDLIVLDTVDPSVTEQEEALRLYEEHIYQILDINAGSNGNDFVVKKDSAFEDFLMNWFQSFIESTGIVDLRPLRLSLVKT